MSCYILLLVQMNSALMKIEKIFILISNGEIEHMQKIEFNILVLLTEQTQSLTPIDIAALTNMPLICVDKAGKGMCAQGYIVDGKITDAGITALEPYRLSMGCLPCVM